MLEPMFCPRDRDRIKKTPHREHEDDQKRKEKPYGASHVPRQWPKPLRSIARPTQTASDLREEFEDQNQSIEDNRTEDTGTRGALTARHARRSHRGLAEASVRITVPFADSMRLLAGRTLLADHDARVLDRSNDTGVALAVKSASFERYGRPRRTGFAGGPCCETSSSSSSLSSSSIRPPPSIEPLEAVKA
jgi:hypothetical protein